VRCCKSRLLDAQQSAISTRHSSLVSSLSVSPRISRPSHSALPMPPCDTTPTLWLQSYRRAQTSSEGSPPYPVRGERGEGFGVRSFAVSTSTSTSSQEATRRDRQFDTGEETRPRRVWFFNGFGCLCVRACMRACLRRKRETWRHIIACGVGGMGVYFGGGMTPHATNRTKTTEKIAKHTSSFRPFSSRADSVLLGEAGW
jgi:hypothetical protein